MLLCTIESLVSYQLFFGFGTSDTVMWKWPQRLKHISKIFWDIALLSLIHISQRRKQEMEYLWAITDWLLGDKCEALRSQQLPRIPFICEVIIFTTYHFLHIIDLHLSLSGEWQHIFFSALISCVFLWFFLLSCPREQMFCIRLGWFYIVLVFKECF